MDQDYSFLQLFITEEIYPMRDKTEHAAEPALRTYGENKQYITLIVDEQTTDFMRTPSFAFLNKVMEAVKLSQHEYAIVNLSENPGCTREVIEKQLEPRKIIGFGVLDFLKGFSLYQPEKNNKTTVLLADALSLIESDKTKKKALWNCMQAIFL